MCIARSETPVDNHKVDWHGSFAVIVTPFDEDGNIDEDAYRQVVDLVIEDGCHGIISAGSTGQFFLMSDDERKHVFAIAAGQAAGRVPVLAGTSAIRTEDVVDLTRAAADVGCDGVMVLPPIYVSLNEREVKEFYRRVSGEGGLPILLYNSPLAVRTELPAPLVRQLAELDNVVAIKDSSRNLQQVADLIVQCGADIRVFVGEENQIIAGVAMGADGAVAMVPQVVGRMAVDLYETAAAGELDRARELHEKIVRVYDLFKVGGYVALKESMNMLGRPGGYSRPPMLPLTDDQRAELRAIFEDVGLLPVED
jgi:4-hydroxy-tetrahydrodipicolinate synthase